MVAPTTRDSFFPCRWKIEKKLDEGDAPGSTSTLLGSRSGRAALKEGASVAVGGWSPRERRSHEKTARTETSRKKER
jgi:hypothetical protein